MSWQPRGRDVRGVQRLWLSDAAGPTLARALLTPFAWVFGASVRVRNALYDQHLLPSHGSAIPVVSVGNLSVGGTGKTPLAAYLAQELRAAGAAPALVMRGVGGDESLTYSVLAPGVPVIVDADRVRGVQSAVQRGADVAVLDDAFQHRRLKRDADIVVLSAERSATGAMQLLPAGPQREPFASLRRAHLAIVVRKAATPDDSARVSERVRRVCPDLPIAEVALTPARLVGSAGARELSLESLADKRVLAIAGVGDPAAFFAQVQRYVRALEPAPFRDHHAYSAADAARLADCAGEFDAVVCTLKDAVKLGPIWPRQASELWYVSQRLEVEKGEAHIQRILARLLDLRPTNRQ
jgi:tetraacyldisaccharide 4'-kinase